MVKITDKKQLTAGILYCLFTHEYDSYRDEDYDKSGALVYWTGNEFVDEEGDTRFDYWDYAVAQSTTPDPHWVDEPWVSM